MSFPPNLTLYLSPNNSSNGLVQQQSKRLKEKEHKKKRSKNNNATSPMQSPATQQVIPEGQMLLDQPGTSKLDLALLAASNGGEGVVPMVQGNEQSLKGDEPIALLPAMPALSEESPATCITPGVQIATAINATNQNVLTEQICGTLHQTPMVISESI